MIACDKHMLEHMLEHVIIAIISFQKHLAHIYSSVVTMLTC